MDREIQTRPPAERQSQLPKYLLSRVCTTINVNSSPHSAAYMRRWIGSALLQIMVCRLFGTKPLSEQTFRYSQELSHGPLIYRKKLQWNFNQNRKLFIDGNASEYIVCEMAAILNIIDVMVWFSLAAITREKRKPIFHMLLRGHNEFKCFGVIGFMKWWQRRGRLGELVTLRKYIWKIYQLSEVGLKWLIYFAADLAVSSKNLYLRCHYIEFCSKQMKLHWSRYWLGT